MTALDSDVRLALADIDPAELGSRIKRARVASGLTQTELADGRISTGYLSRIESGSRRADAELCQFLADRLGISVNELVGGITRDRRAELEMSLDHAELSLAGGSHVQAEALARQVRDAVASSSHEDLEIRARYVLARCAEAAGDRDVAITELQDLLRETEGQYIAATIGIDLSRCLRESGDAASAVDVGESTLRMLAERNLDGLEDGIRLAVTVAAAHYERGDIGQALRMCREAIASADLLDSDDARASAYWNASIIEQEAGRVNEAVRLARKAVAMMEAGASTRSIAKLRTQLGLYYLSLEQPLVAEAEECLERASRELEWSSATRTDVARNQLNLARVRVVSGRYEEAIELADHVLATIEHELMTPEALVVVGMAHLMSGARDEAGLAFDAAELALKSSGAPQRGRIWFELADCLQEFGETARAALAFREAAMAFGPAAGAPRIVDQNRRFMTADRTREEGRDR